MVGDDYPNKLMYFDKLKLDELIQFEKRYNVHPPNLKLFQSRVKLFATYLDKTERGVCNFMFGKDYNPLMLSGQSTELTMLEKINLSDRLKLKKQKSILEVLNSKLNYIMIKKAWTMEETGENLALLLAPEVAQEDDESAEKEAKEAGREPPRKKNRPSVITMVQMQNQQQMYYGGYGNYGYSPPNMGTIE